MALSDFTVRVSGTVAYEDGSNGSFEASAIWQTNLGNVVATHSSSDSAEHFSQLYNSMQANVDSVFAVLPGTITLTAAAPTTPKTVSSFVMEISGIIAEDNNSKSYFVAQWVNGAVDLYPSETDAAWALLTASASGTSFMQTILETLATSATVSA